MNKKSKLDRLACKLRLWLPVIYWLVVITINRLLKKSTLDTVLRT